MKKLADMSAEELAGLVCETLRRAGITTTLSGGGCVAIWSEGKYVSRDLDFIEEGPVPRRKLKNALAELGFVEQHRYFVHPDTEFYIEFPTGPLTVGDERVHKVAVRNTVAGRLRLLSPTDCVKDRLAAYFHWNDRQALAQAVLVAEAQSVDMVDLRRWAKAEDATEKLLDFEKALGRGS
ncbi:MAG: hypothetical protein L0H63_13970 [Nitrococcus sp.]|nr:hypothetical protein [Nitrococcus sp.]